MKELTLNDLAQSHADQAKAALDRGRGADMTTRGKCMREAPFHGDAAMLLDRCAPAASHFFPPVSEKEAA